MPRTSTHLGTKHHHFVTLGLLMKIINEAGRCLCLALALLLNLGRHQHLKAKLCMSKPNLGDALSHFPIVPFSLQHYPKNMQSHQRF